MTDKILGRGSVGIGQSCAQAMAGVDPEIADETVELVNARQFTIDELTQFYNQSRMDYIVPMPMNPARLRAYIDCYDVALEHSAVAIQGEQVLGLSMLGVRPGRTWITRLGVLPVRRRNGAGLALMQFHVDRSRELGVDNVTLEVIHNNVPAHQLFLKLGFRETRDLLILRRPPGPPRVEAPSYRCEVLGEAEALALLEQRQSVPSWLDDLPSLRNTGNLMALKVETAAGGCGWLTCQSSIFQLGRLVLQTEAGDPAEVAFALAHALHTHHPAQDMKTENLPADDPHLPGLLAMGYLESFRRIEMRLCL